MSNITYKFLLVGDNFMPEMHLKQSGFTYHACGRFIKNKERIQKWRTTRNSRYIYRNKLDKVCFQYRDHKDLTRRTTSEKV